MISGFERFKNKGNGRNKKGNFVLDMIIVIVIITIFAFSIFFGYMLLDNINTDFQADSTLSAEAKNTISNFHGKYPSTFDAAFLMFLILIWIFFLVSTFFLDSHPLIFFIFLILIVFVLITSMVINNVWYETVMEPDLAVYQSSFPIIMWYFDNILMVWIVISMSVLITLFGKSRMESGAGGF